MKSASEPGLQRLGIPTERLAEQVGVHRNTIARWRRAGLLPGGWRAKGPDGVGWTTMYPITAFSRATTIKRLTGEGFHADALKGALERFDRERDVQSVHEQATKIYTAWMSTTEAAAGTLEGTSHEVRSGGTVVRHQFPIAHHIRSAVRRRLCELGLDEPHIDRIVANLEDGELVREAIENILRGFAPVLVANSAGFVYVAPDVALAELHAGETDPLENAGHPTAEAAAFTTVRLYPILQRVWAAWGKTPIPPLVNYPAAVVRQRAGDEIVEYDCWLHPHGGWDRIVGVSVETLAYSVRRAATSKNRDQDRFLTGTAAAEPLETRKQRTSKQRGRRQKSRERSR